MEKQFTEINMSPEERIRLVRLCAKITGNVDVAEDLAQETLLEVWRYEHTLRDPARRVQWVSGIARNVCLRWLRKRRHDLSHLAQVQPDQVDQYISSAMLEDTLAADFDIEVELERKELITLLDRALALLPLETRTVLIKRYIEESPLAEIAAELSTNVGAVAMRLQRGKLTLRRVLTSDMRQEIAPYTIQATTVWFCSAFVLTGQDMAQRWPGHNMAQNHKVVQGARQN